MSDLQTRAAAAEIVQPPQVSDPDAETRRDVAVELLKDLYPEIYFFADKPLNDAAIVARDKGKIKLFGLGEEQIRQRIAMIEGYVEQSAGSTRDEKIAALLNGKQIYGVPATRLYETCINVFEKACVKQVKRQWKIAKIERKFRKLLRADRPTPKQVEWLARKRDRFCGPD